MKGDKANLSYYKFLNKMKIDVNMLGVGLVDWVGGNEYGTFVIT